MMHQVSPTVEIFALELLKKQQFVYYKKGSCNIFVVTFTEIFFSSKSRSQYIS